MPQSTETQSFTVSGVPTVVVRNKAGKIYISSGPDGQVGLSTTKVTHGPILGIGGDANLDRVRVNTEQRGNDIHIDVEYDSSVVRNPISVEIELTVPAHCTLDLRMAAGDMHLNGLNGVVRCSTNAGNVEIREVTFGDGSRLEVNAGRVEADASLDAGASLEITVNTGQIRLGLPASTAVSLDARVDVGSLQIDGFSGALSINHQVVRSIATGQLAAGSSGALRLRVNVGEIVLRGK